MAKTKPGDAVTFVDGQWHDDSPAVIKPRDHGFWLASNVFDGARSMFGRIPDLDLHCQRLIQSAEVMGMAPTATAAWWFSNTLTSLYRCAKVDREFI